MLELYRCNFFIGLRKHIVLLAGPLLPSFLDYSKFPHLHLLCFFFGITENHFWCYMCWTMVGQYCAPMPTSKFEFQWRWVLCAWYMLNNCLVNWLFITWMWIHTHFNFNSNTKVLVQLHRSDRNQNAGYIASDYMA